MNIDKGKKGEKAATDVVARGPQSSIGPEDGKGGVISSIKDKLANRKVGVKPSLGDLASHSIKGVLGGIRETGKNVSDALSKGTLGKVPLRPNVGNQPTYGTPAKKFDLETIRPKILDRSPKRKKLEDDIKTKMKLRMLQK
jgi:hypothetical protein